MAEWSSTFAGEKTHLIRKLSAFESLGLALSGMGLLYAFEAVAFVPAFNPGANPIVVSAIGLLLVLPIATTYALLSTAMPRTGGDYIWTSRVLTPGLGFVVNFSLTALAISLIGSMAPWIPRWSLGQAAYDLGILWKNSALIDTARYFQTPTVDFWISASVIVAVGLAVAASTKLVGSILRWWTVVAVAIALVFMAVVLSTGSGTFQNNFNAVYQVSGTANYTGVIAEGQVFGGAYPGAPPALSNATTYAGALGVLAFLGFYSPAYVGGEVKRGGASQLLAQVGGCIVFAVLTTAMVAIEYIGEGPSFANSIAALWVTQGPGIQNYPYFQAPLASGLSMFWTTNPALVTLFNLSFGIGLAIAFLALLFSLSRNVFAWSFDRILPSSFASVSRRTGTPVNAIVLTVALSLFYLYLSVYEPNAVLLLFLYGAAGIFLVFMVVSLAAVIYPYRRRDLFDAADLSPRVRRRIGPFPIIALTGILSLVTSGIAFYAILFPPAESIPLNYILWEAILPAFVIGIAIYLLAYVVRAVQRVDLEEISRELPPE